MKVSLKKLLPTMMRTTRWGELIEVVQDILLNDLKPDKIDIVKTQFQIESMTNDDISYLMQMFGRIIPNYSGYTDTPFYFKRQALSLIPRYLYRNTKKSYVHTSFIYCLDGSITPIYNDGPLLYADDSWETNDEELAVLYYFDTGLYFDDPAFPFFDVYTSASTYTRFLLYTYKFKYVESVADGFLSTDTCRALYKDIEQQKRKTEIIFYEPHIEVDFQTSGTINTTTWNTYPEMTSGNLYTVSQLSSGSLYNVKFINIQNTDTAESVSFSTTSGTLIETQTSGALYIRKQPTQKYKMIDFNKVVLKDVSSGTIATVTLPMVNYDSNMYGNWKFTFNLV